MLDVDVKNFFEDARVPCERCGQINDLGSSEALYYAELSTPCQSCGFLFLAHINRRMQKLMEMGNNDPQWRKLLRNGSLDVLKERLKKLVPIPND